MAFQVFHRTWWRKNTTGQWPDDKEPGLGKRHNICRVNTEEEARDECTDWNESHSAGKYSDRAEYDED